MVKELRGGRAGAGAGGGGAAADGSPRAGARVLAIACGPAENFRIAGLVALSDPRAPTPRL